MRMSKSLIVVALATSILSPSVGRAAKYQLGTPFPIACEGILASTNGMYSFAADDENSENDDETSENDIICSNATIAEERQTKYALKYTLKEKAIVRLLKTCSIGKPCRIVGYVNGLSHDWPAAGSADTELSVMMEPEVCHGEAEVYTRVQA
jgi:hypothetical protein